MSYYYIVASLPTLVLGEPPPLDGAGFLRQSANVLEAGDLAELALVLEGREAEGCSAFSREWVDIEAQLRNAVARTRAAKWSVEVRPYLRDHAGYDVSLEKGVADAYEHAEAQSEVALVENRLNSWIFNSIRVPVVW